MIWDPEIEDLKRRQGFADALGGPEAVERHHSLGKSTARERIEHLVDSGSWREWGALAGDAEYDDAGNLVSVRPSNTVVGTARIDGRRVAIEADDYTIRGGSTEATISEKWIYPNRYALEMGMPIVRLVENAGGSVKLIEKAGSTKIPGYPTWPMGALLGQVPVVGVALGPCAGLGALQVAASHFSVMVKGTSQLFAGGPPVAARGMSVDVSKEDLGGSQIHTRLSGLIDNEAEDEADALAQVRRFLSYLPDNVDDIPPVVASEDDPERREDSLLSIIPREDRRVYDSRQLLRLVLDEGSMFEIAPKYGASTITFLARLGGRPVGVIANDPFVYGGGMTRSAAEKMETFIDLCDTFHLPVINFVDQPGTVVGPDAEKDGAVRGTIRVVTAIEQSTVPWCAVVVRRLFGLAGTAYGRLGGVNLHYAWPSARWGSIPLEGGVEAAYRRELDGLAAEEREQRVAELEEHYQRLASPFRTAERFKVPAIIDPRDTRPLLCEWVEDAYRVLPSQLGRRARTMRR